jgi:hypothetical protein
MLRLTPVQNNLVDLYAQIPNAAGKRREFQTKTKRNTKRFTSNAFVATLIHRAGKKQS